MNTGIYDSYPAIGVMPENSDQRVINRNYSDVIGSARLPDINRQKLFPFSRKIRKRAAERWTDADYRQTA